MVVYSAMARMETFEKWVLKRERYRDGIQEPEITSSEPAHESGESVPGVIPVPPYSCMADLWREWQATQEVPESRLDLRLADENSTPPLTLEELKTEAAQCTLKLFAAAKRRYRVTRTTEGNPPVPSAAQPVLHLAQNQMAAWIMVFPPVAGGAPVEEQDLWEVLDTHMVSFGVNKDAIAEIASKQIYFRLVLVACGKLPGKSENGRVEEFYPHKPGAPETDEMRIATMLNPKYLAKIAKGTKICRRVPAIYGAPGETVLDTQIPSKPAEEASLVFGKNIEMINGDTLVAAVEGYLYYEDDRFHVQQTLTVEDGLEENSDLIDFDGDVWIRGDVLNMNIIRASGSVIVTGSVENSFIQAEKNIIISAGVVGEDEGTIRAGENVTAKFLERCIVYAGKRISCECSICSHLYCNDSISITNGRGVVVGGSLTAANWIEATVIGSRAERSTEVTLGEYPCQKENQEAIQLRLNNIQTEIQALNDAMPKDTGYEDESAKMIELSKYRLRLASLMIKKQRLEKEIASMQANVSDYSKCELRSATIFPKTSIIISEAHFYTQDEFHDCTFRLVGQKIRAFRNSMSANS